MHIPRTRARRAQIHPPTDIYHPIDGSIYPKPMYILQNVYSPFATDISSNCWQYIQYKCRYYIMYIAKPGPKGRTDTLKLTYISQLLEVYIQYKCMYIPQPCAQRAHSATDIYPPIVGSIYPIQMYILQNVYSPTLCPNGA